MYREGPPYQRRGSLQLWQFLVTLLDDPANAHFIAWTGRGMEFKLIEPEEVSVGSWDQVIWFVDVCSCSPLSLFTVLNMLFLLIQILAWPMGLAVPFLLIGQLTIHRQAEFSAAEYIKCISNTSANSGEGGHEDLHSNRVCSLCWKVFFKCSFSDTNLFWCQPSYVIAYTRGYMNRF